MPTSMNITIEDQSKERSSTSITLPEITVTNFTGVTQDLDEIRDAIATVILGEIRVVGFTRTYNDDTVSSDPVTDKDAQRESKWLVTYQDVKRWMDLLMTIPNPAYLKTYTFEIPTANRALLLSGTDYMDISQGVGLAFVQALEANVKSPYNRDAVPVPVSDPDYIRVLSVKHVGRNT